MVWGYLEDDRPWHDDINDPVADEYSVILGFNEPNHADQADIPPEVAASAWMELQNLYPDRVREAIKVEQMKMIENFHFCATWSSLKTNIEYC